MQATDTSNTASNELLEFCRAAQALCDPLQALSALHEAGRLLDAEPEPWEVGIFLGR